MQELSETTRIELALQLWPTMPQSRRGGLKINPLLLVRSWARGLEARDSSGTPLQNLIRSAVGSDMAKLKELHYDLDLAAVSAELTAESMTGVSQSLSAEQWRELATRFLQRGYLPVRLRKPSGLGKRTKLFEPPSVSSTEVSLGGCDPLPSGYRHGSPLGHPDYLRVLSVTALHLCPSLTLRLTYPCNEPAADSLRRPIRFPYAAPNAVSAADIPLICCVKRSCSSFNNLTTSVIDIELPPRRAFYQDASVAKPRKSIRVGLPAQLAHT